MLTISITLLVLVAQAWWKQPIKNIKSVVKMVLDDCRNTIRQIAIFKNVLGMKHAVGKIVPKLLQKKKKKTTSHGHRWGDVGDFQKCSRLTQKSHNSWRVIAVWPWYWNQSLIIPMKASRRAKSTKNRSQARLNMKGLLTISFDCNGMVHHEFLPQNPTVNKE